MKRTLLALVAVAVLLVPAPARAKVTSQFGISIQSCVVNNNGSGQTNGINVVYYNTHPSPATEVDFLVRYHYHRAVLTDRGTFTQGSQINHNLTNGMVGYTWQGADPYVCSVQRVVLQNGKVFQ